MILTGLLNITFYLLNFLLSLFPIGGNWPDEVHTGAIALGEYLNIISPIVPINTLATVIALVFTVEIAFFGWRTLKWIFSFIPVIGGKG